MNSSIAENVDATTDGTKEEKSSVRVTDKRGAVATDAVLMAGEPPQQDTPRAPEDTRYEDNMKVALEPEVVDPVDALMHRTFDFITSQPEWFAILQLPRPARKKLGQEFGKLLTRFPHFSKIQ